MTGVHQLRPTPVFAVLGAGNGGLALAAHLALNGAEVRLYNRSEQRLQAVLDTGTVKVEGAISGVGEIAHAGTCLRDVVRGADVIMVAVPALAHLDIAKAASPWLSDGQIVVLNPGRTFGALEFRQGILSEGCTADVIIAEAQTFLYAARAIGPAHARVFSIKHSVPVASIRAHLIPHVVRTLRHVLPSFVPGDSVFRTSFDNIGAVFHPTLCVLNAGRIEDDADFQFYTEGVTPSVARVLEMVDAERVRVAAALGFRATTALEWLYLAYHATGSTLYHAMQAHPGYRGIMAPNVLDMRYITEDVPASLVPIASLGDMFHVDTPAIDSIVHLASVLTSRDFATEGRTAERLGIAGMSLRDLRLLAIGEAPAVTARMSPPLPMTGSGGAA